MNKTYTRTPTAPATTSGQRTASAAAESTRSCQRDTDDETADGGGGGGNGEDGGECRRVSESDGRRVCVSDGREECSSGDGTVRISPARPVLPSRGRAANVTPKTGDSRRRRARVMNHIRAVITRRGAVGVVRYVRGGGGGDTIRSVSSSGPHDDGTLVVKWTCWCAPVVTSSRESASAIAAPRWFKHA